MNFKGKAIKMQDEDLPRIGHKIGVGEDEMHAFLDVEARGSGFDGQGRPKMLFEPHIFYRELSGAKRSNAESQGLAYRRWKRGAYPRDSYPRLKAAMKIDENAALRSASWGIGQIMGFNCKLAGFRSAREMVEAFKVSEANQLEACVEFIISAQLDDDLRRHDWAGFARGYNGSGYAAHGYHIKLEKAYRKWAKIPDTPWEPESEKPKKDKPASGGGLLAFLASFFGRKKA